jgi:ribosomal-protein-alanine N-acetyltransferase
MEIEADGFLLRPWRRGDEDALVRCANNYNVWINLTDAFPHPYTAEHAQDWIALCQEEPHSRINFAIDLNRRAIGGIGFNFLDTAHRFAAEIGYWLGKPYWGRGIATEAVRQVSRYAFERFDVVRLQAKVFEWNSASCRVLEKAGYTLEARMARSCMKDGRIIDTFQYVLLK